MQTQQLRYFLEVAKTKNITTAARNLYISQPSLSQQIINLEKELEIPLLIRHSKSVSLTDAGEQFAVHTMRIMNEMEQLSELMQRHSLLKEGTLRLGMLFIGGYVQLLQILEEYRQAHPALHYHLTIDGSSALLNQLLSRSLHAAFLIGSENQLQLHEDLYYQKVMDDYYIAVISTKNPLSRKELLTIEDLRDEPIIMPAPSSAFRRRLDQLFVRAGFEPRILCETSQTDLVNQLTRQNFGIGFFSCTIARALQSRELAAVPFEHTLHRSIYYVTLKELLDYPSIKSFTEFIEHYLFLQKL